MPLGSSHLYSGLDNIHGEDTAPEANTCHSSTEHGLHWFQVVFTNISHLR